MSYKSGTPNGDLYIGHVKWSNDYKHVMLFSSKSARNTFMSTKLTRIKQNVIYINPNKYVDVKGSIEDIETYNYIYYINDSDISSSRFCAFITNYEYVAPETTRLYLEIDVFQTYYYDTTFYQSFIERAIIAKANDDGESNTLPEPVSAPLLAQKAIKNISYQKTGETDESVWEPYWVLHMASKYNAGTKKYDYDGFGTDATFGEYGRFIQDTQAMRDMIAMYGRKSPEEIASEVGASSGNQTWQDWVNAMFAGTAGTDVVEAVKSTTSIADLQDHRNELIGLYAIPKWLRLKYYAETGEANYATNRRVSFDTTLTVDKNYINTINGDTVTTYTPRNKKMLTSVCRAYVLANKTGMIKTFKPELFTSSSPIITLSGITMSTSGYQWHINNYKDNTNSYDEVAYNSERRVGYDANTGLNKVINTISAGSQIVGAVSGAVGNFAAGNVVGGIQGLSSTAMAGVNAIDTIGQKEQHFGHNGDLLRITDGRAMLTWYEMAPLYNELVAIDNFFDMYGYSIRKHANPFYYLYKYTDDAQGRHYHKDQPTRSKWNYIKTDSNINLSCQAPADYENKLKSMFANGITFWHDYDTFGNYSATNS